MAKPNYITEGHKMTRKAARAAMFKCYPHKCLYCQSPLSSERLTMDHLIPTSKGGMTTIENIVPACHGCNSMKGDSLPTMANCILASEWLRIPVRSEKLHYKSNPNRVHRFDSEFLAGAFA